MKKQYNQPQLKIFHITAGNLFTGSTDSKLKIDNTGSGGNITGEDGFGTNKKHPIWGEQ